MLKREKKTAGYMVQIYCKGHHGKNKQLCPECEQFKEYVYTRLEKCPGQDKKTACGKCLLCFTPEFKEKAWEVMGYAGPKMFLYHPSLSLHHLWDARREPPQLAEKA